MEDKASNSELARLRELNHNKMVEIDHHEQSNLSQEDRKEKTTAPNANHPQEEEHQHGPDCSHDDHKHKRNHHGTHHGKPGKKNYLIIFYTVFTCLSCLYLETKELNPLLNDNKAQLMSYLCVADVILCLWSYFQTMCIGTSVEKMPIRPHYPYSHLNVKKCEKCDYIKVPRVSHCSTCGKCIYKLDHHCIWTQTCIGYCNQKPFYLFTLYMTIGVLQFWYSTLRVASKLSDTCQFFSAFEPGVYILWAITCISAGIVGMMIVTLWAGHTVMIATNFTTLDSLKKKAVCPLPLFECRSFYYQTSNVNDYDRGEVQNLKSFFGTNILTWWLPFGRSIENEFIFQPLSPYVNSSNGDVGAVNFSKEGISRRLSGKKIAVGEEVLEFQDL